MAEAVLIDIGKSVAVEASKALVKLILNRASGEARLAWGFEDQLDKLRRKLEYVEAFLEGSGQSKYQGQQNRLVETWLKRFQDVAYLTDNLMDEYAYVIISRKLKLKYSGSGITKFRYKVVQTPLFFRFRMSLKVNHILSLFDELDVEAKTIGLNQVEISRDAIRRTYNGNGAMSLNQAREHVSVTNRFVGRKDDERDLLKELSDSFKDDSSLPIVAIVGMGDQMEDNNNSHLLGIKSIVDDLILRARALLAIHTKVSSTNSNNVKENLAKKLMIRGVYPSWVRKSDRKLLEVSGNAVNADVMVAKDGSGKYKTVGEAVKAAPEKGTKRYVIYVKKGVYKENIEVGKTKLNVMLVGDGMGLTIITGSQNVVDGSTTFNSATLGLGKTTLARRVYDHQKINTHFADSKIWICVSENFNIIRLLNEMVEAVTSNKGDLSNKDGIIRKLGEKLKGKKFLLVLDDVWKEDQVLWDSLRESLKRIGGLPGSMMMITTRSKKVADAARAVYNHELEGLSEDDSWELLKQNVDIDDGSSLEEIGRRIANKCKGVPLAINVIGSLLRSKQISPHEWEAIERSELWELPQGRNHILPSLLLSFNHLPSTSLKQCFASCAIFPKGRAMGKEVLIAYWLAQGFLHVPSSETRRLTDEDIGGEICSILLNNLFLQEYEADEDDDEDEVLWYKMHDLVHDLAVYLSNDLLLIREANDQQRVGDYRHLIFASEQDQMVSAISKPKTLRNLRTLLFQGIYSPNWWVHARYVRTLVLRNTGLWELPPAIGTLHHMRFLDLSFNPIIMLPDMICKLYHLQTLRLRGCPCLTNLPSLLNRLVNLRHIFTTTPLYASKGLVELKNLQTLPHLALKSDQGWTIDELGALPQLRGEICIRGLEHVKNGEQAGEAALYKHGKVMKMSLTWAEDRDETSEDYTDEDVLNAFQPHPAMSSIELENFYGKAFPSWIMKMTVGSQEDITGRLRPLSNLTTLKLQNCSNCQTLPTLGHLPSLSTLIMTGLDVEFIGSEFYGNSGGQVFRSLRKLVICNFLRLTTWMVPTVEVTVVFPCLQRLEVEDCPELKAIPALHCESLTHLKLHKLITIKSLDIIEACTGLTSLSMYHVSLLKRLPDELANCRNLQLLELNYLKQLMYLPSLKSMECLTTLRLFCPALIYLPDDFFHGLSALRDLYIFASNDLRRLPSSFKELTSLQRILIHDCEFENVVPASLSVFRELWSLCITSYSAVSLRSMLEAVEQLPNIKEIGIQGFKDEQQLEEYFSDMTPFLRLQSLKELRLTGYPEIRSLPEQLGLLIRITTLELWSFSDLEEIPDWVCNLSSLETLEFMSCYSLRYLPSKEAMLRLTRLRCLLIYDCLLLAMSIKYRGPEWHKVKHLSYIAVDGVDISSILLW